MFLGHYGLAFGAKKLTPSVSLGVLFAASQFADLLWPTLVLLGVEKVQIDPGNTVVTPLNFVSYPYSHSLEALVIWGVLAGLAYWLIRRSRLSAAVVIAALVVSHWVLDAIVHRADLPVTLHGTTRVGFGIWYSLPATIFVEGLVFAAGALVYTRATQARDRIGSIGFWSLIGFLAVVYTANVVGPPPPSASAVAWAGEAMWLLVAWGYWVDRHRYVTK